MNSFAKKNINQILQRLGETFPDAHLELDYNPQDNWQLLVVVALSAQTTDKKVNIISPALFERFKTVADFALAQPQQIEPYIKSIGLYRNKAKNMVLAAQRVMSVYGGKIPNTRAELETLAGVGQKGSAVIVAQAFNEPAIPVDTHVSRVSFRLGLTTQSDPNKIEKELMNIVPKSQWINAHHRFIFLGRRICLARKPKCSTCPLSSLCPRHGVVSSQ